MVIQFYKIKKGGVYLGPLYRGGTHSQLTPDLGLLQGEGRKAGWEGGGGTHRTLRGQELEELGGHPAFRARDARAEAETVAAGRQLLAEAKVGEDHPAPALTVGLRNEHVAGFQVPMHCRRSDR